MAIDKIFDGAVDGIADNLFNSVSNSVSEIKAMQQRKAAENVQLVVQSLKKIDADIRDKFDGVTTTLETRIANIKDGRDGIDGKNGRDGLNGKDGRDGKDGRNGRDGATGPRGFDGPKGLDGKDGKDGEDGVSVEDAHIDFDGSLIITLSSGRVINVGEVVAADIAEKIKVITNGGGTSQPVLDELASLQAQIDLISSALVYKGTWNANTNLPTLASSTGTANTFYIVSVAGSTNLDGVTNWGVGDWAVYNGSTWQRIEGGAVGNFTDLSVSGTTTLSGLTASTALALNASKAIVSVTNTGTGNNVLATSPTLTTPNLGTPSAITLTNATSLPLATGVSGTLPIGNGGTGQTTATNAFTALAPSQTGNSGKYLTTNGTSASWATVSAGVTSVAATVPSFLSVSGSPITSSGTLAFSLSGSALPTSSGGTGLTSFTNKGVPYASSTSALTTGTALQFDGTNFGVGATPSAWGATYKAIEVGDLASLSYESNGVIKKTRISTNSYNATAIGARPYYKANGLATEYYQNVGEHVWSTAPSGISGPTTTITSGNTYTTLSSGNQTAFGAANNSVGTIWGATSSGTLSSGTVVQNIEFVEAMRIDASANVGIGTYTPGSKLDVKGTLRLSGSTSGYVGLSAAATAGSTTYTLPSSDGTANQALVTNGSGTLSWASTSSGTVTSVAASVPSFLSVSGSPITSSGTLAISLSGTALPTSSGGTGLTSFTSGGVAYASSSSALATGSSLQFDGTNLLVGTTTSTYNYSGRTCLELNGSTDSLIAFKSSGTATGYIQGASATFNMYAVGNSIPMVFGVNGSERARIDTSGNFGLGVTPSSWGATYTTKVLQIGATSALYTNSYDNSLHLSNNQYDAGSSLQRYIANGYATDYRHASGQHQWFTAPSGTAGLTTTITNGQSYTTVTSGNQTSFGAPNNTIGTTWTATSGGTLSSGTVTQNITFTQAMSLDASGNLSVLGSITNTAGTANGVAYLNGSKVVTSGSALTFDGTTFKVNGSQRLQATSTGSTSNGYQLDAGAQQHFWYLADNTTSAFEIGSGAGQWKWSNSGGELMRLTSTGLGIGTSSPSTKLTVAAASPTIRLSDTTTSVTGGVFGTIDWQSADGSMAGGLAAKIDAYDDSGAYGDRAAIRFFTNNASSLGERMRLDSSGNLGLGVTPTNNTLGKTLQVGQAGAWVAESGTNRWWLASNWYYNSGDKYINNGYATLYSQQNGTHQWQIAASGTAGNAITFTQAMTLDASGNLLIGATSVLSAVSNYKTLQVTGSSGGILDIGQTATAYGRISADSSGLNVEALGATYTAFRTNGSERARIDSSGNLLVGTTSKFSIGRVCSLAADGVASFETKPSSNISYNAAYFLNSSNTMIGRILCSTTDTTYVTTSDYRLKEDVQPMIGALAKVATLKPVTYKWKTTGVQADGFIAHELAEVCPQAVAGEKDAVDANGKLIPQGIDTSFLVATLTAAIQEQQVIIESLKARLDAANL